MTSGYQILGGTVGGEVAVIDSTPPPKSAPWKSWLLAGGVVVGAVALAVLLGKVEVAGSDSERKRVLAAMHAAGGKTRLAAADVGMKYRTFLRRVHDHRIPVVRGRPRISVGTSQKFLSAGGNR